MSEGNETPVQTLAGIVLRLQERVERLARRLDAMDPLYEAWLREQGEEGSRAEVLAQRFHETYERLAPSFGLGPGATPWTEMPERNRALMTAVCQELLDTWPVAK